MQDVLSGVGRGSWRGWSTFWRHLLWLLLLVPFFPAVASSQPQWVLRWNEPASNAVCRVVGMAVAPGGTLVVAGESGVPGDASEWVFLKVGLDGSIVWSARHAPGMGAGKLEAFSVDSTGAIVATGQPHTVRLSSEGKLLWTAPVAGRDLALDSQGAMFVTGASSPSFSTVKLTAEGTVEWTREEVARVDGAVVPSRSDRVVTHASGELSVAGFEVSQTLSRPGGDVLHWWRSTVVRYGADGRRLWKVHGDTAEGPGLAGQTLALHSLPNGGLAVGFSSSAASAGLDPHLQRWSAEGALIAEVTGEERAVPVEASAVDDQGNFYGSQAVEGGDLNGDFGFLRTRRSDPDGSRRWTREFDDGHPRARGRTVQSMAWDGFDSVLVTGSTPTSGGDLVVYALQAETGVVAWVGHYDGEAGGLDEGVAVVADELGHAYVAGTSVNAAGGTELVVLRYSASPTLSRSGDDLVVDFRAPAGTTVTVERTTDLKHWMPLAQVRADDRRVARFVGTNAFRASAWEFYRVRP